MSVGGMTFGNGKTLKFPDSDHLKYHFADTDIRTRDQTSGIALSVLLIIAFFSRVILLLFQSTLRLALSYSHSIKQFSRSMKCAQTLHLLNNLLTYTYSMAQVPMESLDRPLLRVSLSNSILVTLIFY